MVSINRRNNFVANPPTKRNRCHYDLTNWRSEPEEWVKKWLERELDPSSMKDVSQQSETIY